LGSISQEVKGFGIVRIQELPRAIVSDCAGQVDSIFCKTGDPITKGQELLTILSIEKSDRKAITSPFDGTVTGLNMKEGSYVVPGTEVVEMVRNQVFIKDQPEVIFFIEAAEVPKLKTGMKVSLLEARSGIPAEYLTGSISFIAAYPVSAPAIKKYFSYEDISLKMKGKNFYEVRASIIPRYSSLTDQERTMIIPLNGLACKVSVSVSRKSPISYLLN